MSQTVLFFLSFVAVLALIGLAAWLVRRFAGNRLGANTNRGRMPRLAVIDAAAVDGRRRLVLVRRDNIEHLLMIGGPTDIVVEPNIVRATPARDQMSPRPAVGGTEPPPRIAPLPDSMGWSDGDGARSDSRSEGFGHAEPQMPEPPPRPVRPSFADEVRRPARSDRGDPLAGFTPEPLGGAGPPRAARRADAVARDVAQRTADAPSAAPERAAQGAAGSRARTCRPATTATAAPTIAATLPGPVAGGPKSRRDGATVGSRIAPAGRRRRRATGRRAAGGARTAAEPRRPPQRAIDAAAGCRAFEERL